MSDVERAPKAPTSRRFGRLKSMVRGVKARLDAFGSGSSWNWGLWLVSLVSLFLLPVAWLWLVFRRVQNCPNIETASAFSSDPIRFVDYVTSHGKPGTLGCQLTSLGDLHRNLAFGYVIAVANLLVFAVLWAMWWKRAWLTTRSVATRRLVWAAVIGAFADVVENIVQHASIGLPGAAGTPRTPNIGWFATRVLPIVAWVKVLSFAAVWLLLLFTLIAAFSRRRLHGRLADGVERATADPAGLGICCSGGGIRAASVSLGALGVLERTREDGSAVASCTGSDGILDQAKYLASVSGGGYTAGAWRIARGTAKKVPTPTEFAALWPSGVIGAPDDYDDVPPVAFDDPSSEIGTPSLFRHLQQRREFLRTGRGGFSASLFTAVGLLAIHLCLLLGLLLAIAWPIGRLSSTSYVYGGIGCRVNAVIAANGDTVRAPDHTILDLSKHGDLPASLCTKSVAITKGDELMRHSPDPRPGVRHRTRSPVPHHVAPLRTRSGLRRLGGSPLRVQPRPVEQQAARPCSGDSDRPGRSGSAHWWVARRDPGVARRRASVVGESCNGRQAPRVGLRRRRRCGHRRHGQKGVGSPAGDARRGVAGIRRGPSGHGDRGRGGHGSQRVRRRPTRTRLVGVGPARRAAVHRLPAAVPALVVVAHPVPQPTTRRLCDHPAPGVGSKAFAWAEAHSFTEPGRDAAVVADQAAA